MQQGESRRGTPSGPRAASRPVTLTRRTMFALAGGALLGACSSSATDLVRPDLTPGKVFYGAAMPPDRVSSFEAEVGARLSCHRTFFQPGSEAELIAQARDDVRLGRAPLVSIKPPGDWAATAGDTAWLDSLVGPLSHVAGPVFLIIHHEPENDTAAYGSPADFVAMQNAALARAARAGSNVFVVPVLSSWSFNPVSGRQPQEWDVAGAAIYGLDLYNPWSATNGKTWQPFADRLDLAQHEAGGRPILVGEYGCRTDPSQPGRAAGWLVDAFNSALGAGVIAMAYFDSYRNSRDGSWELDDETLPVFTELLHRKEVARISTTTLGMQTPSSGP